MGEEECQGVLLTVRGEQRKQRTGLELLCSTVPHRGIV